MKRNREKKIMKNNRKSRIRVMLHQIIIMVNGLWAKNERLWTIMDAFVHNMHDFHCLQLKHIHKWPTGSSNWWPSILTQLLTSTYSTVISATARQIMKTEKTTSKRENKCFVEREERKQSQNQSSETCMRTHANRNFTWILLFFFLCLFFSVQKAQKKYAKTTTNGDRTKMNDT